MSVYIIGEMAWGHMGSLDRALEILHGVKEAGADAISIHMTDMDAYMVRNYRCDAGTTLSSSAETDKSIFDFLAKINLPNSEWQPFCQQAKKMGIDVVAMCNDRPSFESSKALDVDQYVVSAACFLEHGFIRDIVSFNPRVILRIGGATLQETKEVVQLILSTNSEATITLLAGIQLYPSPIESLRLASIRILGQTFKGPRITMGLADHIDGGHPFAAYLPSVALEFGATVLEKHVTTRRTELPEDYEAALDLEDFKTFVSFARMTPIAVGDGTLDYLEDDEGYKKYRNVSRKKIVAARDIPAGTCLQATDLAFKRADLGAQVNAVTQLVGRRITRAIRKDEGITLDATC